jgi:sortase B
MRINISKSKKKYINTAVIILCAVVFVYSSFMIVRKMYGYYIENKRYEDIRKDLTEQSIDPGSRFSETETETETEAVVETTKAAIPDETIETQPLITRSYTILKGAPDELGEDGNIKEYGRLLAVNPDLVGWIVMPGFDKPIDYPILQSKDNDYYLNRDFYGNYSYSGSIFMDFRNDPEKIPRHMILYGHAMNDRSMFGNLKEYPDKPEQYVENDLIYVDLLNYRLEYKVFSTYYEDALYNYRQTFFRNDREYYEFLLKIQTRSIYDFGQTLDHLDKILTLSTCNNNLRGDIRTVIHARLTAMIVYSDEEFDEAAESRELEEKEIVSANVYLKALSIAQSLSEGSFEQVMTDPGFDPGIRDYIAILSPETRTIKLDLETADPEAKVIIFIDDMEAEDGIISFVNPKSFIKVRVTSRDMRYIRTYTIRLFREEETQEESDGS